MSTTDDLSDDLKNTKTEGRQNVGGTWISGSIAGHTFQVLVFPEHAEYEDYELGTSRISKLWLRRQADRQVVANFDRAGTWNQRLTTPAILSASSPPGLQNTPLATNAESPHGSARHLKKACLIFCHISAVGQLHWPNGSPNWSRYKIGC
jgi:hypothetical protein